MTDLDEEHPYFGLSRCEYREVLDDLLDEADIAAALDDAAEGGLEVDSIYRTLFDEHTITSEVERQVDEASKGAVSELIRTNSQIARADASAKRLTSIVSRWGLSLGLFGAGLAVAGALTVALGWQEHVPTVPLLTAAAILFIGGTSLRLGVRLPRSAPFLNRYFRSLAKYEAQRKPLAIQASEALRSTVGQTLRPKITLAMRTANERRSQDRKSEKAQIEEPITLEAREAPALMTGTRTIVQVVNTKAYRTVEELIDKQGTAAIGIAGPRGVGKSTLINRFCVSHSPGMFNVGQATHRATALKGPILGIRTSVPVQYDPRDFLLHLYAESCREVLRFLYALGTVDDDSFNKVTMCRTLFTRLCRAPDYANHAGEPAGQCRFGGWKLGIIRRGCCGSEGVEICQEAVRWLVAAGGGVGGCDPCERPLFDGHVGVEVGLGRVWGGVAHPQRDHRGVDADVEQGHCGGVPQGVGGDVLGRDART
jgi:hypothetical protein